MRMVSAAMVLLSAWGCNPLGPSCLERQQRGPVTSVSGTVAPGQVVSHQLPYGSQGSQNDAKIDWAGQFVAGGPQIQVYATRAGCTNFRPPPASNSSQCAVLGRAGAIDGLMVTTLMITNGRGNPDVLGSTPEYKLWIVGDSRQTVSYSISTTFFYGPDC